MTSTRPLAIVILVDGARPDVFGNLLHSGRMPEIEKEILSNGTLRTAISCCPSTTGPAYLPFLTGCFPGTLNIPGIRWLDKNEYQKKTLSLKKFRSYNGIEAPLINSDMPGNHPTLFELFERPFNIFSPVTRGLPRNHNLAGWLKPFSYLRAHMTGNWKPVDKMAYRRMMKCLDYDPDFVFAVFPGVDSFSHLYGPFHEWTIDRYRFVDFAIGKTIGKLKGQGRWNDTLLIITSDHGLTETKSHFDLALFFQERKFKTLYYPLIWKINPEVSVMVSGNALGHIYWLSPDKNRPARSDAARQQEILNELISRAEIDFVLWKDGADEIIIDSARGRARILQNNQGLRYLPETGDPLRLGTIAYPINKKQALEKTFDTEYPDALVQIPQLFCSSRCGDLVAISRNGYDLRQIFEWPEHRASHGSLHREHMAVPLIYNQTGWNPRPARTADIFNTILEWSGKPALISTDGESLLN